VLKALARYNSTDFDADYKLSKIMKNYKGTVSNNNVVEHCNIAAYSYCSSLPLISVGHPAVPPASQVEVKERQRKAAAEEAKKIAADEELKALVIHASPTKRLGSGKITHVFLTHNWSNDEDGRNNHDRVSRINKALQRRGFITWFDEEKMNGQIRQKMTEGIKQTHCVVVCITKIYQEKVNAGKRSDNCYFEFDYASRKLSDHMIPVVMESYMLNKRAWDDRLDSELGGILYVDMTKDDEATFERKCDELSTRISNLVEV
jgi:hypothetical protein